MDRTLFHSVKVGQSVPTTYLPSNLAKHEFTENGLEKRSMGALIDGTVLTLLGIGLMLYYLRRLYFAAYILKHGERRVGYIGDKRMSIFMSRLQIVVIEDRKVIDDQWSFWRFPFPHIGRHRKDKIDVMYDPTGEVKTHWCGDLK